MTTKHLGGDWTCYQRTVVFLLLVNAAILVAIALAL